MSQKVKIYGVAGSTCTRRIISTLEELEIAYEIVKVDLAKGEHKQPAHLARQPFGQIPAFEDVDGTKLFESRAIIRYIAHAYPKQAAKLVPKDNQGFANVEAWMNVESENYSKPITTLVSELFFKPVFYGGKADEAVVEEQKKKLGAVVDVLEKHFVDTKWQYIAGNQFTLADIVFQPYTEYLVSNTPASDVVLSRPHVAAWWKRISERPTWQKVKTLQ